MQRSSDVGVRLLAAVMAAALAAGCGGAAANKGAQAASGAPPAAMAAYWSFSQATGTQAKTLLGWSRSAVFGMTPTNNYPEPNSSTDAKVAFNVGALEATVTGPDAWILSPDLSKLNLQGESVGSLEMRVKLAQPVPDQTDFVELYWANDISGSSLCCNGEYAPGNWGQNGSISGSALNPPVYVNGDGQWHTLTLPIAGNTNAFTGQVYGIRVDLEQPQGQAATTWEVQWIGLTKA